MPATFSRQPIAALLLVASTAWAQSAALLDAVRMHRPEATAQAQAERAACQNDGDQGGPDGGTRRSCADERRLSLLEGLLLVSDGDPAGAAKQLARVKPPAGLEAFHGWYLGEAQSWSGAREEAVKTLLRARKTAPAWLAQRIDLRLSELYLASGQAAKARPMLEAAAATDPTPETLYSLALARWASDDRGRAREDLKSIVLRFPTHPHAALATTILESRGGGGLTLTAEEQLQRAQALLAAGESRQALAQLDGLTLPGPGGVARVALVKGQALLARGSDTEGFAQLALAAGGTPNVAAEALLVRARRLMRVGDSAGARQAFGTVDRTYLASPGSDEAGYFAAWLSLGLGELDVAVTQFTEFEARHAQSRKRDEARWFRAYSLYRLERYPDARAALLQLMTEFPRSQLVPQAKYWAARCAQRLSVDVSAEYRELISEAPGSFYALLAEERLRELNLEPPLPFPDKPALLSVKVPTALGLAVELTRTGLFRDASEEIQRAVTGIASPEEALVWGHALQGLGEYGAAHAVAARHLWGAVYTAKQPEALALMYPRAWPQAVEKYSAERGLDPFLAWAIMRRESAFRAEVISAADARGLMQIIPPTARAIAAELKVSAPDPDDLYSPSINVQFGTWYLSALLDRLHHPALMAAAYNAGPTAVVRWASLRKERPIDEWIEEIPYKETRGYVKQVLADYFLYRQLYADSPVGRLSLVLPEPNSAGVTF